METKPTYRVTTKTCPFEGFPHDIPTKVLIKATLDAQDKALAAIVGLELNAARLELFWVVFNYGFRQHIERWLKANANIEKRPNKT